MPLAPIQLHITNGDSAAEVIRSSGVGGDVLPWRDPMHHGPFPAGLDLDESSELRATYLAGSTDNLEQTRLSFRLRNEHLRSATRYQEVVFWFEHDLLDQLQLLELLNWFSDTRIGSTKLTHICINDFPGIDDFRGLGQLNGKQIATLLPQRVPVTREQLRLAKTVWEAFRSNEPSILTALVGTPLAALPFLQKSLQRYLQEFPWACDGLTRTERQILRLVASGVDDARYLFVENMNQEDALYIGDLSTYRIIARLTQLTIPLLSCVPDSKFSWPPAQDLATDGFHDQTLSLTDDGHAVLAGERTAHSLIYRDEWLGGVHLLSGHNLWQWDNDGERLVFS